MMTNSTSESEYIKTSEVSKEATSLNHLIDALDVVPVIQDQRVLFFDNEVVVDLTKEPKYDDRSIHIDRKYHYLRHKVEEGPLMLKKVSSEDNHVDPFTKALNRVKHNQHAKNIGLRDSFSFSS